MTKSFFISLVVLTMVTASTVAFADDAAVSPRAVLDEGVENDPGVDSDPAGDATTLPDREKEPSVDETNAGADGENADTPTSEDGARKDSTKKEATSDEKTADGKTADGNENAPLVDEEEPMGGIASFFIAYGVGGVIALIYPAWTAITAILPMVAAFLYTPGSPLPAIMSSISTAICCFLPAGQGLLIAALGDAVTGAAPGLAYATTVAASYCSCYALGCATSLINGGVIIGLVGTSVAAALLGGQPPATAGNIPIILAGTSIGLATALAIVQPLAPALAYVMSRDTGADGRDGDDAYDPDDFDPDEDMEDGPTKEYDAKEISPRPFHPTVAMAF